VKRFGAGNLLLTIGASALIWFILAAACLFVGSSGMSIPFGDVLRIRLDQVVLASLVGAALAAAGVVYQAILQNPLADPYLLGVSSGAMLFSYLWQFPAITVGAALGEQSFAFAGAMIAIAIVFAIASRGGRLEPITMLLVGVIVNAVNGSIFLLLNAIVKDPARPGGPLAFLVGGLQTTLTAQQLISAGTVVGIGWFVLLIFSGELNVALLSEGEATSLGVRIHRLRWFAMLTASLITASAVAISGPIGFVGLVCPHLARLIVGNDQRRLLPISTALGAGLLAIADAASRWLASRRGIDTVLPVGVLTGLMGGPFFLLLLWQRRRRTQ
jgi:iron complex transport system permease protein